MGTALAFGAMLAVHSLRIIRVTPKFTRFVIAAGIALMGLMVVNWLASFFIEDGIGIRSGGPLAFIFSIAAILLGCFFLLLDFNDDRAGRGSGRPGEVRLADGVRPHASRLVWIYLEVLRFLSYFSSSDWAFVVTGASRTRGAPFVMPGAITVRCRMCAVRA